MKAQSLVQFAFTEISGEISIRANGASTVFSIFNQESVNEAPPSLPREVRSLSCSFGFNSIILKLTLASWTTRTEVVEMTVDSFLGLNCFLQKIK